MRSPEDALRATNDYPVVVRHGKLYLSVGIIGVLAGGIASLIVARATIDAQDHRIGKLEDAQVTVAKTADVQRVSDDLKAIGARVDNIYTLLIEAQKANPHRGKP